MSLPALDQFPRRVWGRLLSRHARRLTDDVLAYGDPAGYLPLREQIALYLRTARAVRCEASQVVVVSGSQMALQLCSTALVERGHAIGMEEPGYPGAREAFRSSRARLVAIPVDGEGIVIRDLASRARGASLVYVTPSHQYPLGVSMTVSRRLELLSWAKRNRAWIVEDDYDSEYRYASRPLGSLQGMDAASRVIYVGTFSKVLFPSLRIGYLVLPLELVERFVRLREGLDLFSATINQVVLTDFLAEGHFARHVRRMRPIYLARRNALVAALREHLGDRLTIHNTDAGLHLTTFLQDDVDDREVVLGARRRGIAMDPLSACYAGRRKRTGLILGFGGADAARIRNAVRRLGRILPPRR